MKYFYFACLLTIAFGSRAQIMNGALNETYANRFYFESQRMDMYRTLVSNDDFLPTPLGERANENSLNIWSHQLGICIGLSRHLYLDGGVSWLQNGEAYAFEALDSDSTFSYQTRYRYLALPLQVKMTFGDQFKFYGGIGIIPALYQGFRQDLQWSNALGAKYDDEVKVNNAMNSFAFSWMGSVGIETQFDNYYTLRFGALYRQQLNNSYSPFEDYMHKSVGWGLNLGLAKKL